MAKSPVFVIPHAQYDSYADYWRLVKASGFEAINQDLVDHKRDVTYIISPTNGDLEAMLNAQPKRGDRNATYVLWFLERPAAQPHNEFRADIASKFEKYGFDQIWFSDRAMHNIVKDVEGTRFVVMGSDEAIGTTHKDEYHYDYTHMSYVWGRRSFLDHPHLLGVPPGRVGGNCWGDQRDHTLRTSKFMINVHQDWGEHHEPLRFALCAAYGIPMITERCEDPFPYVEGRDFVSAPYDNLIQFIQGTLQRDYNQYKGYGLNMWDTATRKFRFKNNVEGALV